MKKIKTAVILAAGMGIRLNEIGRLIPKGFIRLGEKTIIEESIEKLKKIGIMKIIIVSGHLNSFYKNLAKLSKGLIEIVNNNQYAESGSLYSLYLAHQKVEEDFLLLESDLIYEERALHETITFPEKNVILLSGPTYSGDEVYVKTMNGYLYNMSKDKNILGDNITGELVGISRISTELYSFVIKQAEKMFKDSLKVDYETGLVASSRLYPINCHLVSDLIWAEIDDEHHLYRAKTVVYPRIKGNYSVKNK